MSERKPPRPIAGDVGTDNRIDCPAGYYWVRLFTQQAIRREGAALANCLVGGNYSHRAGDEDVDFALWSLRRKDGSSIGLADVVKFEVYYFLGVKNNMVSKLGYRMLRHLRAFYQARGGDLAFDIDEPAVIAPGGEIYRWDHAPKELRRLDHEERLSERRRQHEEARNRKQAHADNVARNLPPPAGQPEQDYYVPYGIIDDDLIDLADAWVRLPRRENAVPHRGRFENPMIDSHAAVRVNGIVRQIPIFKVPT